MATETGFIQFVEGSAPSTPGTGKWRIYTKSTGLYVVDDAGTEYGPLAADGAAAHIADTSDAHDASAISLADAGGNTTETDVEGAIDELYGLVGGGAGATVVRKASDETVNNSSTLQDDNALLFAIGASETWVATFHIYYRGANTTADLKVGFTVPSGATMRYAGIGAAAGIGASVEGDGRFQSHTTAGSVGFGSVASATGDLYAILSVSVVNSTNAGNVTFQWAQLSAGLTDLIVLAGSFLVAHKVA